MKFFKQKALLHFFLGFILLQFVFLMAFSVNFLLAQIPSSIIFSTTGINANSTIEGTKSITTTIDSSNTTTLGEAEIVTFAFDNPETSHLDYNWTATKVDSITWKLEQLDTTIMENGTYNFYTKAFYGGSIYSGYADEFSSEPIQIYINNTVIINPLEIVSFVTPNTILSGNEHFYSLINKQATVNFYVTGGPNYINKSFAGIYYGPYDNNYKYYFDIDTTQFLNGTYTIKIQTTDFEDTTKTVFQERTFTIENSTTDINITDISTTTSTTTDLKITSFYVPTEKLSGKINLYAYLNKYIDSYNVKYYIIGGPNNINEIRNSFHSVDVYGINKYYIDIDTTQFPNGTYTIKVEATDNIQTIFQERNFSIENQTTDLSTNTNLQIISLSAPLEITPGIQQRIWTLLNKQATVNFYVTGGPNYINKSFAGIYYGPYDNNYKYYFDIDTTMLGNGTYTIKVEAINGMEKVFQEKTFTIIDTTTNITPINIQYINIPSTPLSGDIKIFIKVDQQITKASFHVFSKNGTDITYNGINSYNNEYYFIFKTMEFKNDNYQITAIINKDNNTFRKSINFDIYNSTTINPDPINPTDPIVTDPIKPDPYDPYDPTYNNLDYYIPYECKERGLIAPEECENYMRIPFECRQNNITDMVKCENYLYTNSLAPECKEQGITTYQECNNFFYLQNLPSECKDQGITTKQECDQVLSIQSFITLECKNANITTPEGCETFMMENFMPDICKEKGVTTRQECDYLVRNSYNDFNFNNDYINPTVVNNLIFEDELPFECKEKNITSFEECEKLLRLMSMPQECREQNITSETECEKVMFNNYAPKECIDAGISSPEECEIFMFKKFAPDDCKDAGIFNPEACKKFMFEKYGGGENIPADKFPVECKNANAKTIEECEKIMTKQYMPKECKDQGFDDENDCEIYLQQKHMPKECRDANATTRQECDRIMFKKFGPPECRKAGIEDEIECEEFMFNKYAPKVKCNGLENWQCNDFIKERHLGNIIAKQNKFDKIREKKIEIIGKSINVSDLENNILEEQNTALFTKKSLGLKIISAEEELTLNDDDSLIQTAPIIIMIDSDEDGLPDDIEERLGTDPYDKDTDKDGYKDGDEIKNGYNPNGEGKFEAETTPIEKAILENKQLEHPKTKGVENENLSIKNIKNKKDDKGNSTNGYVLSGKSEPDSTATLYIYSDLPLVVTVETDEYGNWKYDLKESLVDGEHEAYVVINDNTGKVINKSKPMNFFVKEAKAVSAKNFISSASIANDDPLKKSDTLMFYYLIAAVIIILIGIILFIILVNKKKKQKLG